jgi:peroxiredoxin Q/BCP
MHHSAYAVHFGFTLAAALMVTVGRAEAQQPPNVGDQAPRFTLKNQDGADFALESRAGKGWTVLYFYPKAETPGCTTQACTYSGVIDKVRALGAEVYGISADTVAAQKAFHENHALKFDLLADPEDKVISAYGVKRENSALAKRWTFILDSKLAVRAVEPDVDPVKDAAKVIDTITALKGTAGKSW